METELFVFFWKNKLSQWHQDGFNIAGIHFCCAEQAMMFLKAKMFDDIESADEIMRTTNPADHRSIGRKVKNFDQTVWSDYNIDIVYSINYFRFTQNPDMLQLLLSYGNKTFVEASPYDKIWGVGLDITNPDIKDPNKWRGENRLGRCLTSVRNTISSPSPEILAAHNARLIRMFSTGEPWPLKNPILVI